MGGHSLGNNSLRKPGNSLQLVSLCDKTVQLITQVQLTRCVCTIVVWSVMEREWPEGAEQIILTIVVNENLFPHLEVWRETSTVFRNFLFPDPGLRHISDRRDQTHLLLSMSNSPSLVSRSHVTHVRKPIDRKLEFERTRVRQWDRLTASETTIRWLWPAGF